MAYTLLLCFIRTWEGGREGEEREEEEREGGEGGGGRGECLLVTSASGLLAELIV